MINDEKQEISIKETLNQIKMLYSRALQIWENKEKYWKAMQKSSERIVEISQQPMNETRVKLIKKIELHLIKLMKEYLPTLQILQDADSKAQKELAALYQVLYEEEPSEQILQGIRQVTIIKELSQKASDFNKS